MKHRAPKTTRRFYIPGVAAALFVVQGIAFGVLSNTGSIAPVLIMLCLLLMNLLAAYHLDLSSKFIARIHPRNLIWGLLGGLLGAGTWIMSWFDMKPIWTSSVLDLGITLCIVTWEELWFRGTTMLALEQVLGRLLTAVLLSSLFVALHVMNPELDLAREAPNLWLGSYCLCTIVMLTRSFWSAVGLHMANNVCHDLLTTDSPHISYEITLLCLACVLTALMYTQTSKANTEQS